MTDILPILLLAVVFVAGCGNTVDPYVDSADRSMAIVGYLDMAEDTQFVRVTAIRPGDARRLDLDADVVSTHLGSRQAIPWSDSLVMLEDGSPAHLFFAPFIPDAGAAYSMEVRASGRDPLRAYTRVPPSPIVSIDAARVVGGEVTQRLTWQGIRDPAEVSIAYHLQVGPGRDRVRVDITYDRRFYSSPGDDLRVVVPLHRDFLLVRADVFERFGNVKMKLDTLEMDVRVLSSEWLNESGAGNIENGEGFFASVGSFSASWAIADTLAGIIGFSDLP